MRAAAENQLEHFKDYIGTVTLCRFPGGSSNNENAQVFRWQAATSLKRLNLYGKRALGIYCKKKKDGSLLHTTL